MRVQFDMLRPKSVQIALVIALSLPQPEFSLATGSFGIKAAAVTVNWGELENVYGGRTDSSTWGNF